MEIDELKRALDEARECSREMDSKGRSGSLHSILDKVAGQKGYYLKLRK